MQERTQRRVAEPMLSKQETQASVRVDSHFRGQVSWETRAGEPALPHHLPQVVTHLSTQMAGTWVEE